MNPYSLRLTLVSILIPLLGSCDENGTNPPDTPPVELLADSSAIQDLAVRTVIQKKLAAVKRDPESPTARRSLALAYEANAAWAEAAASFRAALVLDPDDHAARLHLAICLLQEGNTTEHVEQLERVVKKQPNGPAGLFRLGQGYLNAGRFLEARQRFSALCELLPSKVYGHVGLGQVLLQQDDAAGALPHLRKAQSLDTDNLFISFVLGQCLADLEQDQEALPLLSRGAGANPPQLPDALTRELDTYGVSLPARLARANRLTAEGSLAAALRILKDLQVAYPDDPTVLNNLGATLIQAKEDEAALNILERLIAVQEDHAQAWVNISSIHLERGVTLLRSDQSAAQPHLIKALAAADKATTYANHSSQMHAQRGRALMALGGLEEAIAEFRETIRLGTTDQVVYLECSRLLFRQGRQGECLAVLLAGAQTHPEWVEVRIQILPYHVRRKDSPAARSLMEEIRTLAPKDPRLADILNLIVENGL